MSDNTKETIEVFPYSEEQYDNRIVLNKLLGCFTGKTLFTVYLKSFFTDKTVNSLVIDSMSKTEILESKNSYGLYKVNYCYVKDNVIVVNIIRKYNCTADKFFDGIKKRKSKNDGQKQNK